MRIFIFIQAVCAGLAIALLSGCAGSTGWRFEIGVSPVKQLSNTAGLTQEKEAKERY